MQEKNIYINEHLILRKRLRSYIILNIPFTYSHSKLILFLFSFKIHFNLEILPLYVCMVGRR